MAPPSSDSHVQPGHDPLLAAAFKVGLTTLLHPSDYAKTLMQLGHEPLPPTPTHTFLGRPALALPSVFRYIGVIKKRDGVLGLYAGLGPRLAGLGANHAASEAFARYWPADERTYVLGSRDVSDALNQERLINEIKRGSALRLTCVIASQPFQVIAVRVMAQFVGRESKYDGVFAPIIEIFNENGLLGFWQGLIPRAIAEVLLVCLTSSLTFAINRFIMTEKDMQQYTGHISGFIASSLVYPFHVVSNCMIVSRSGLAAGYPPNMPFYHNWVDCYRHLSAQKQLKRGSSLLFRYYTGPQVTVGDRVIPFNRSIGLQH